MSTYEIENSSSVNHILVAIEETAEHGCGEWELTGEARIIAPHDIYPVELNAGRRRAVVYELPGAA